MASITRPPLDYTGKDFDGLLARIDNLIDGYFPDWTDRSRANYGNILRELVCHVGDMLTYYQDEQAGESRWTRAKLRRSLLGLIKMIGYVPAGNYAATVDLVIELSAVPAGDVSFDAGDVFSTLEAVDPIEFQLLVATMIAAGTNPPIVTVTLEHSRNVSETFQSTGSADQTFELADSPYLDGSAVVTGTDGAYTQVDNFLDSGPTDRHFTVTVDENGRALIATGNGKAGAIPPSGTVSIDYKVGGGSTGIVEKNTIRKPGRSYTDSFGNAVTLTVTNPEASSGGIDRASVAEIRDGAPRYVRTPERCVADDDFENAAYEVAGIARAVYLSKDRDTIVPENQGYLYVVPEGGGTPTQALLDAVVSNIVDTHGTMSTFVVRAFGATYVVVDVQVRAWFRAGTNKATGAANIRTAISDLLALDTVDATTGETVPNDSVGFGYEMDGVLAWSDVFDAARDVAEVRKIDDGAGNLTINGVRADLALNNYEFPVLGTVTVIDAETGSAVSA